MSSTYKSFSNVSSALPPNSHILLPCVAIAKSCLALGFLPSMLGLDHEVVSASMKRKEGETEFEEIRNIFKSRLVGERKMNSTSARN